jgi:hypothetical protein
VAGERRVERLVQQPAVPDGAVDRHQVEQVRAADLQRGEHAHQEAPRSPAAIACAIAASITVLAASGLLDLTAVMMG